MVNSAYLNNFFSDFPIFPSAILPTGLAVEIFIKLL